MSFGKLYGFKGNARTTVLLVVAAENNLDVELIETIPDHPLSDEYLQMNPMGLIPTFRAPDGWVLTEVIAIACYFATQNPQTTLLGKTSRERAQVTRWMSFVNSEVQPHLAGWFKPLIHRRVYVEGDVARARGMTNRAVSILEDHLLGKGKKGKCFLIGETVTLADLVAASSLSRGFMYVFDAEWRRGYPGVTRWFLSVVELPIWRRVVPEPVVVERAVEYRPKASL